MRRYLLVCILSVLLAACSLSNSSNIKISPSIQNLITEGKTTAMDVEMMLGPKYLYSFGYKEAYPEFNGKRVMVYDAGASMENDVPFMKAYRVQHVLVVVLNEQNIVIDKKMLTEIDGQPPL